MRADGLPGLLGVVAGALYVPDLSSRPGGISALGDQRLAILFDVYRLLGRTGTARGRLAPRRAEAGGM